ncbi:MAG: DUF488 family protein [Lachnospiraceae bacterium]|nr:DUF488 family protein [Lachnospiraceae bacterium]
MPRKIRHINHNYQEAETVEKPAEETASAPETLTEEEAAKRNDELLKKEIAEFDRIAEGLKMKERARMLAMAKKGAVKPKRPVKSESSSEEMTEEAANALGESGREELYREMEDDAKAEIAKHVRAREAALRAMKKAPLPPAGPVEEGPLHDLRVKHVLDPVEDEDGTRLLVERVWPKNLNRKNYPMTDWQPAVGPTFALQKELAASPEKLEEFTARYREFLEKDPSAREFRTEILAILRVENVTFLHASEDRSRNSASVLREWVLE